MYAKIKKFFRAFASGKVTTTAKLIAISTDIALFTD